MMIPLQLNGISASVLFCFLFWIRVQFAPCFIWLALMGFPPTLSRSRVTPPLASNVSWDWLQLTATLQQDKRCSKWKRKECGNLPPVLTPVIVFSTYRLSISVLRPALLPSCPQLIGSLPALHLATLHGASCVSI